MKKKYILLIIIFTFILCLSGCTSRYKSDYKYLEELNETIIEALNDIDKEKMKSIFSDKALNRVQNIDDEINYIFELYKGDFLGVYGENFSEYTHLGVPGYIREISGWFFIKTTEMEYKVRYKYYPIDESDSNNVGVYNLEIKENKNSSDNGITHTMAGIVNPKGQCVYTLLDNILTSIDENDVELMKKNFTKNTLNSVSIDNEIYDTFHSFQHNGHLLWSDVGVGWFDNSNDAISVYQELGTYIMYFDITNNIDCRINALKFKELESDKKVSECDLKIDSNENGIIIDSIE